MQSLEEGPPPTQPHLHIPLLRLNIGSQVCQRKDLGAFSSAFAGSRRRRLPRLADTAPGQLVVMPNVPQVICGIVGRGCKGATVVAGAGSSADRRRHITGRAMLGGLGKSGWDLGSPSSEKVQCSLRLVVWQRARCMPCRQLSAAAAGDGPRVLPLGAAKPFPRHSRSSKNVTQHSSCSSKPLSTSGSYLERLGQGNWEQQTAGVWHAARGREGGTEVTACTSA